MFARRDTESKTDASAIDTVIGENTQIQGTIEGEGSLRIDGEVEGTIRVAGDVTVGESGCVLAAQIEARSIKIAGRIQGDVTAEKLVEMAASATVDGDIQCSDLAVDKGAVFKGKSLMGKQVDVGAESADENAKKAAGSE